VIVKLIHLRICAIYFQLSRGGTGDSMFRELSNFYASPDAMDVVMYPMRSLDSLASSDPARFGGIDFVKLDVQGAELEVLEGAAAQLNACVEFVLLEAPLRAFNEVLLAFKICY